VWHRVARRMAQANALAFAIHRLADRLGSRACSSAIGVCALQTAALVLHYNNRGVDQRPVAVNTDRTRVGEVDRAALLATGLSRRIRNGDFDERAAAPAANRSGLYLQAGCPHPQRGPCIFPFAQSSEQ
jgi:hypothetical protein